MSPQDREKTLAFEKSLHPTGGTVQVPGAHSSLNLGDQYYFLPAEEAKKLLVEAWGNPPDSVSDVLGMVFPKGRSFYDGTWGAVVTYDDTGHVEDKDAQSQDYDSVLENMKSGEADENAARKEAGYGAIHLVGWAQAPTYDSANKTLIWARNIKFDGAAENTLNYDVRKLARSGVVSMNMIDGMSHLALVRTAAGDLGRTVQLDSGSRYADFDSSTDKMADYGLAGLVAAGAGVAVAKKAGLLGIILLFLKKGIVIVLAAAAGAWAWFKRKFGFGKDEAGADEADYSAYSASSDALPEAPAEGDPGKTA
jgi:uncharacterized membrane-anchored protein